jgi:hypothetical protein
VVEVVGVDLTRVQRGLDALYARGRDTRPVLAAMRIPARKDQMQHGKEQQGPNGPWKRRAASTTSGRSKRRRQIRRRRLLGRLSSAVVTRVARGGMVVESQVAWSEIHQSGGTAGRGAKIPARPFLWWSREILDEIAAKITEYVGKGW